MTNQKKNIFVFDVDGVIFDSTDECLVIAWNAYQELIGARIKITSYKEAEPEYEKKFRAIRNYVRSMDEYLVVFRGHYPSNPTQLDFENNLILLDNKEKIIYSELFYEERKAFKKQSHESWIQLHQVYEGILDIVEICSKNAPLYMVTGKDKESVIDLLNFFAPKIDVVNIYDKHAVENKLIALDSIAKEQNIDNSKIKFIDDNITHILAPKRHGFDTGLASWGYAMPDHILIAKKNNIPIIEMENLRNFLGI